MKVLHPHRFIIKKTLFFTICFLATVIYADVPNYSHPTTFLGPTLRGGYAAPLTDVIAAAIQGEAGLNNYRLSGTMGFALDPDQRLKFSLEYLQQQITYSFLSGNTNQWVNQVAGGLDYQQSFLFYMPMQFDLRAYVSYAPSKNLSPRTAMMMTASDETQVFVDTRRIAGSNANGLSPELSVWPIAGTQVGVALNYDNVRYDKNYAPSENAKGLGGTLRLNQVFTNTSSVELLAAVRKPFNNYQATFAFADIPNFKNGQITLGAGYTVGKYTLPNSYNVLVGVNYQLDSISCLGNTPVINAPTNALTSWVATPAVYMPQVLAIADENITITCQAPLPIVIAPLANQTIIAPAVTNIATASAFTPATGLTYSITTSPANIAPNSVSINPTTGVLTINAVDTLTATVTVTATNTCGASTNSSFTLTIIGTS